MKIITDVLKLDELKQIAAAGFGDMVKAVVDIGKEVVAIDAELHADLEAWLLENGSKQKDFGGSTCIRNLKEKISSNTIP